VFMISLTVVVNAQTSVYHSFPNSNTFWTVNVSSCCWSSCCSPPIGCPSCPNPAIADYNFTYSISGDTTINATSYHKIYKSGNTHEYCSLGGCLNNWYYYNSYFGGIRQDTLLKKVYSIDNSGVECLLYNFSASVGDTMSCNFFDPVTSIDSVLIGNNYRKRFNLSCISVIEGIGSTSGIFELFCPFETIGTLICFSQNGQTLYPDTTTTCEIQTSVNSFSLIEMTSFFPNPFHITSAIELKNDFINSELKIFNALGEQVKQQKLISKTTIINRDKLANGIYFYQIQNNKGILAKGKLMIE
jgi:hypothetical protein